MSNLSMTEIESQALLLARENKKAEPNIESIYWIPNGKEVHLIEVEPDIVKSLSGMVEPFYFDPSPTDGMPAPSGVALIRPEEFGNLTLPENWGSWKDAKNLEIEE